MALLAKPTCGIKLVLHDGLCVLLPLVEVVILLLLGAMGGCLLAPDTFRQLQTKQTRAD